ncbi:MAG: YbfB/YjiJ family MFS transporter [Shinella sp.]|nr:YbfB/YjiJ family MFS transporter [Shinella sp.]
MLRCNSKRMLQAAHSSSSRTLLTAIAGAVAMAVAMGFGRFFYTPVLPSMMEGLGLSAADAGFIAAANFAGYLAGAVLAAYGWAAGIERRVAIAALAANALLLLAMGLSGTVAAFSVIRFLAGLSSAFAMIFTSGIVLSHGLRAGDVRVQMLHFSGVGSGIALSSLVVYLISHEGWGGFAGWRVDWFAAAALAVLGLAAVHLLLPAEGASSAEGREPRLQWTRLLAGLTLSYGLFGVGYVVTATFIVAIARHGGHDPLLECLTWLVTGIAAALSLRLWKGAERRLSTLGAYVLALLLEAAGVAATVVLPAPWSALTGGLLLGMTVMVITAYGLQLGRQMAPDSPRRILAMMTAAFGVGQIVGPLMAGWLAERSGSYTLPSLIAAAILIAAALICLAVRPARAG